MPEFHGPAIDMIGDSANGVLVIRAGQINGPGDAAVMT